ncbi:hypothetical protein CLAC_03610 [Corynebacterium lactis RW2-5]|uniref:Uncharacterized protein n=1 Tax=Corynebacterium lactis RW2-5 TaxID=1408189 RepID=A0A0K2H352_9CORY|nr:hypothetical protein CLAC_03610 [Corynebacterium lactis RW2-5]
MLHRVGSTFSRRFLVVLAFRLMMEGVIIIAGQLGFCVLQSLGWVFLWGGVGARFRDGWAETANAFRQKY